MSVFLLCKHDRILYRIKWRVENKFVYFRVFYMEHAIIDTYLLEKRLGFHLHMTFALFSLLKNN